MPDQELEIVFALEGERNPCTLKTDPDSTVGEFLAAIVKRTERPELVEVFIEDEEVPLANDGRICEAIVGEFRLFHVVTKGDIRVTVLYSTRSVSRDFRPSATMERIIRWAISPKELNLEGGPEDFQLKDGNEVLPPDLHLGQIAKGHKHVTLTLVFKVKPQG